MLGTFQHWRLCYPLLRLDRFISWLKTKLPRNLKFLNLLSFPLRYPANAEGFARVVTKQRTKIHLRLGMTLSSSNIVDWRLNLKSKNTLKYHLIISVESKAFRLSFYTASLETWRHSENSETENQKFHPQSRTVTDMWTNKDILSWVGKRAKKCFYTRKFCCKGICHFKTRQRRGLSMRNPVFPLTKREKICYVRNDSEKK